MGWHLIVRLILVHLIELERLVIIDGARQLDGGSGCPGEGIFDRSSICLSDTFVIRRATCTTVTPRSAAPLSNRPLARVERPQSPRCVAGQPVMGSDVLKKGIARVVGGR